MAESEADAAKRKRYNSQIITLKVGKESETLTIHEDNLRQSSPFFRAALDKHWKEGTTDEIVIPEDDIKVVSEYVDWLYRAICMEHCADENGNYPSEQWKTLAKLYVFGEKVQDARFSNAVLARMLDYIDNTGFFPGECAIQTVYEGTPVGSPVRQMFARMWVSEAEQHWFDSTEEYPEEFMMDLAMQLIGLRGERKHASWTELKDSWMKPE
ncbi:hypothetical protein BST61_g1808 [Cercospora zeina]